MYIAHNIMRFIKNIIMSLKAFSALSIYLSFSVIVTICFKTGI